jgi:hypothetical protein
MARKFWTAFLRIPMLARAVITGAVCMGFPGAVAGLAIGLKVHAPTAPFAVIELGYPAAVAGTILGLVIGLIVLAAHKLAPRFTSPRG